MRILHIIHQYLPEKVGGTELYTQTLARFQVAQGHHVAIVTPTSLVVNSVEEDADGVRIYRVFVGERGATAVFRSNFRHPDLKKQFSAILQNEQPDLVHIQHLMGWPVSIVDDIQAARIPVVITLHDYWHLCANAQLITNYDETVCAGPNWWLNCARCGLARAGHANLWPLSPILAPLFAYRQKMLRPVLDQATALIAPTQFTRHIHEQMGLSATAVTVVPHGIQLPDKMPPHQSDTSRLRIGYVGGISWQKGVHVLIQAVNQLANDDITLTIIGDTAVFPEYTAQLQQQATHPGIHFQGRLPHDQLWLALSQIDVLVVPSLWYETAALVIQEAFAAHVPVIASNIGALQERVQDGVDGRLVPPGDVMALQNLLQTIDEDRTLLSRWRDGIKPPRTIQTHISDIESIYDQSVDSR